LAANQPITLAPDLSQLNFMLETQNPASHTAEIHLTCSVPGAYTVTGPTGVIAVLNLLAGVESTLNLPIAAGGNATAISISR
jgi:hypothetical protein